VVYYDAMTNTTTDYSHPDFHYVDASGLFHAYRTGDLTIRCEHPAFGEVTNSFSSVTETNAAWLAIVLK